MLAITGSSPETRGHWRWQEPHRPMMPRGCVKDGNIEPPLGHIINELGVVPTNTGPSLGARTQAQCRLIGKPTKWVVLVLLCRLQCRNRSRSDYRVMWGTVISVGGHHSREAEG